MRSAEKGTSWSPDCWAFFSAGWGRTSSILALAARHAYKQQLAAAVSWLLVFYVILTPIAFAVGVYAAAAFLGVLGTIGWLVMAAMGVVGLIEGIMYLTKSDDAFEQIYVVDKKQWF